MRPIREIGIQFVMKTGRLQYRIVNWWSEIASLVRLIAISFFSIVIPSVYLYMQAMDCKAKNRNAK